MSDSTEEETNLLDFHSKLSLCCYLVITLISLFYYGGWSLVCLIPPALLVAYLKTRDHIPVARAYIEPVSYILGHLLLLGSEYARHPDALFNLNADGILNVIQVGLWVLGAGLLLWKGWKWLAITVVAYACFGLLPLTFLVLANYGKDSHAVYSLHFAINLTIVMTLIRAMKKSAEDARFVPASRPASASIPVPQHQSEPPSSEGQNHQGPPDHHNQAS